VSLNQFHPFIINLLRVYQWLRRGFGLVNRFIGSSLVVTTITCNSYTLKITVTIAYVTSLSFQILLLATLLFHWNFQVLSRFQSCVCVCVCVCRWIGMRARTGWFRGTSASSVIWAYINQIKNLQKNKAKINSTQAHIQPPPPHTHIHLHICQRVNGSSSKT
jgi:hypothetical protein